MIASPNVFATVGESFILSLVISAFADRPHKDTHFIPLFLESAYDSAVTILNLSCHSIFIQLFTFPFRFSLSITLKVSSFPERLHQQGGQRARQFVRSQVDLAHRKEFPQPQCLRPQPQPHH